MKRSLPLLLALLLCLTAVSCDKNTTPPSSDPAEENLPSFGGSESESDVSAVTLSDTDKVRLQALIDGYNNSRYPSWAIGKPPGIVFYYSSDESVRMPDAYFPDGQTYDFYVTPEVTAVVLGPTDGAPTVTVAVSHDKAQTWDEAELLVEEAGKLPREEDGEYYSCHIAFRDDDNGLLILFNKETAVTYSTTDGGREWALAGSFAKPEVFYELHAADDRYFLIGRDDGQPIVSQSGDGVHWETAVLPMDREKYTKGDTVYASFAGDIGLAVATVWTSDDETNFDIHRLYFATADGGESWMFYDDIFVA